MSNEINRNWYEGDYFVFKYQTGGVSHKTADGKVCIVLERTGSGAYFWCPEIDGTRPVRRVAYWREMHPIPEVLM